MHDRYISLKNAVRAINFARKYTFFDKKCIFLQKYLVICNFCCTFAPAFEKEALGCYRLVA